ncbi:MAPEG family protein [Undibacterium sp. SXout11W]|uniref:MAPEG family protein n=1 Tax=Undibacterium sp. SXout11W TaxID=3413050 RepID=UPI003BEF5C07
MTIANWCVLAACLLPIITVGLAKAGSAKKSADVPRYNNDNPREWANHLSGWRQRAQAAQNNGWEALPLFIAAVVLAQQAHGDQGRIDTLALVFIGLRILYVVAYLLNAGTVRTLIWTAGVASCIAIFLQSAT